MVNTRRADASRQAYFRGGCITPSESRSSWVEEEAPRNSCHSKHTSNCTCLTDVDEWYRRYAHSIRQFVLSRTSEPTVADDCTSETFLRAITHRHGFRCRGAGVRPWLFTIAKNIVHDYHRAGSNRCEIPMDVILDEENPWSDPEQAVLDRLTLSDVNTSIQKLSPDQARCIRLRFFDNRSLQEIAAEMNRDEGAVRALQYRALRKLAKHFVTR